MTTMQLEAVTESTSITTIVVSETTDLVQEERTKKRKANEITAWRRFDFDSVSFGNLTIVLPDGRLYAHRDILSIFSKVFDRMLNNGMRESSLSEINIEETKEEFTLFLEAIYGIGICINQMVHDINEARTLIPILNKYDVRPDIMNAYDAALSRHTPLLWEDFLLADQCNLGITLNHCIFNFRTLWTEVTEDQLALLSSRVLAKLYLDDSNKRYSMDPVMKDKLERLPFKFYQAREVTAELRECLKRVMKIEFPELVFQ
jgi:hypothetical protein